MEGVEEEGMYGVQPHVSVSWEEGQVEDHRREEPASYRNMLMGKVDDGEKGPKEEDIVSDDEDGAEEKADERDCSVIIMSKKEKVCLRKPWRQTLIIKVLGRRIGYSYLQKRLLTMWNPK